MSSKPRGKLRVAAQVAYCVSVMICVRCVCVRIVFSTSNLSCFQCLTSHVCKKSQSWLDKPLAKAVQNQNVGSQLYDCVVTNEAVCRCVYELLRCTDFLNAVVDVLLNEL